MGAMSTGLYVGRSLSHAANVALIFNPCTGHVSPQFHVGFDDDFTTVPYLRSSKVPPFWADLVPASTKLHIHNKRQVNTWQSLPELTREIGYFTSEQTEIPNIELGTSTNKAPLSSLKDSEGVLDASTSELTSVLQAVSFQDQNASGNKNPQQMIGQCPSQLISTRVDFGASHAWWHYIRMRRLQLIQHFLSSTPLLKWHAWQTSVCSVHMVWEQWHWRTLINDCLANAFLTYYCCQQFSSSQYSL
jgi:hypothetical protein